MAECVSCGKEVAAEKLFCDQCYARMKGRRGPLREAGNARERAQGQDRAADERGEGSVAPVTAAGIKAASGSLTPSSQKKVITLRPELEKGSRGKGERKKRFTITITFSERTYRILSRFKRKGTPGGGETGAEIVGIPVAGRPAGRRKGPHGRPALKAVKSGLRGTTSPGVKPGGFLGWIAYRPRRFDRGDLASLIMAAVSGISLTTLAFTGWVKMSWGGADGAILQEVYIRGSDLGPLTYLSLAVVFIALLYVPLSLFLQGRFRRVDFGFVLLLAGLIFLILFYLNIASNQRMIDIANRLLANGGRSPVGDRLERNTTWAAYLVSFMGVTLAFSGLARLSERREEARRDDTEKRSEDVRL